MKTSLSHLPERHQSEILQICEKIKEIANPEKIILFGSYASCNKVNRLVSREFDGYLESDLQSK